MLPCLTHCYCSFYLTGLFFRTWRLFFKSNKEPLPHMVSRCHKSDPMTNWLFCLLFLFLCWMPFQQSFDPANLMDPHHKHLPSEDVFITPRLDARHLHGSAATDKLACYQQGQRGQQSLWVKWFKTPPSLLRAEVLFFLKSQTSILQSLIKSPQTLMFWFANYNSDVTLDHKKTSHYSVSSYPNR